jgi:SAM-dependent methyltransferase
MVDATQWYDDHARELSRLYEGVEAGRIHAWLVSALPDAPALALDIGCGGGRDADWLATLGIDVVAVDSSHQMLAEAQRLHPNSAIRWIADSLPGLSKVVRLGLSFDLILLSAVWMHVAPTERARAFRKMVTLMKPGGCLAITLRHGPLSRVASSMMFRWPRSSTSLALMEHSSRTPTQVKISSVAQASHGRKFWYDCQTTGPARCRFFGTSFSTTLNRRHTSSPSFVFYVGWQMGLAVMQGTRMTGMLRFHLAWLLSTGFDSSNLCLRRVSPKPQRMWG